MPSHRTTTGALPHRRRSPHLHGCVAWFIPAGLPVLGFLANVLVRPVGARYFMTETELAEERKLGHERVGRETAEAASRPPTASSWVTVAIAWTAIGFPLTWGILKTIEKAMALFR